MISRAFRLWWRVRRRSLLHWRRALPRRFLSSTSAKITPENYSARIKSITVRVCITNCTGILYITDILLQAGAVATGWVGHPCEMKWTLDG